MRHRLPSKARDVYKRQVRTFEAAAALRRYGAETERVRQLFDVTMVEYNAKADLVEKARMYNCLLYTSRCV